MNTKNLSNKELIKRVTVEVQDPELREQLIKVIILREEGEKAVRDIMPSVAVHPDAIPKNVRMMKWLNALGFIFLLAIIAFVLFDFDENLTIWFSIVFFTAILVGPFLIKHIYLSNISSWQRRGKKPTRKWWGSKPFS